MNDEHSMSHLEESTNDFFLPTNPQTKAEQNLVASSKVPFFKFVLTGGPCGGKTTALARIYSYLRERGFQVATCPETFTILASNGMSFDFFATEGMDSVIQHSVLDVQLSLEKSLETVLKAHGKPAVLICDRGPMDGAAYLSEEKFQSILERRNVDVTALRDRYNAIFHMVTAADGAEAHYTLENNASRMETPEQARALDAKTQKAWLGHPHMFVFDNTTDFEGKLQRLIDQIAKLVGLPYNLSKRSAKFLLRGQPAAFPPDVYYHIFEVEKVYLVNQDADESEYSFIRKRTTISKKDRTKRGGSVYQITTVQRTQTGEMIEQKRIITAREYRAAYHTRDLNRHIIRQERISFIYNLQSFTIHIYKTPSEGLCILHAQVEAPSTETRELSIELPPFLDVERQLEGEKDEKKYGAYELSLISNTS